MITGASWLKQPRKLLSLSLSADGTREAKARIFGTSNSCARSDSENV
jgi:hypothetical protein